MVIKKGAHLTNTNMQRLVYRPRSEPGPILPRSLLACTAGDGAGSPRGSRRVCPGGAHLSATQWPGKPRPLTAHYCRPRWHGVRHKKLCVFACCQIWRESTKGYWDKRAPGVEGNERRRGFGRDRLIRSWRKTGVGLYPTIKTSQ